MSLRSFTGISVSWVAFLGFSSCNSIIMSSFSTTEKKNWWRVLLYFSIALMLGWFEYLSIAPKVGCGIISDKGLEVLISGIFQIVTIFEKTCLM